jgi:hypothetical protein
MKLRLIPGFSVIAIVTAAFALGQPAAARDKANSLREVGLIHVDANDCSGAMNSELADRGFGLSRSSQRADATLVLSLRERENDTIGRDGRYIAQLVGERGKVLFSTVGHENSLNHGELCADISDDVADKLRARAG